MDTRLIVLGRGVGGGSVEGAVRYDQTQTLTDAEKQQARENIGVDLSGNLKREIVETLPTESIDDSTIYMVPNGETEGTNVYTEYMWMYEAWEVIGSTQTDLSNYYTKSEADAKFLTEHQSLEDYYTASEVDTALSTKADTGSIPTKTSDLENDSEFTTEDSFKTINGESIVGEGDIEVSGGGSEWFGTQAEFDALTEDELDMNTTYYIKDKLDYSEIANTPNVPTTVSQLPNDADYVNTKRMNQSISKAVKNAVKELEAKHQWLTQDEYDTLVEENALVEGVQYHIEGDEQTESFTFVTSDGTETTVEFFIKSIYQ